MPLPKTGPVTAALLVTAVTLTAYGDPAKDGASVVESEVARVMQEPSAFHGTLLDPPLQRPELTLRDTDGRSFSLADRLATR